MGNTALKVSVQNEPHHKDSWVNPAVVAEVPAMATSRRKARRRGGVASPRVNEAEGHVMLQETQRPPHRSQHPALEPQPVQVFLSPWKNDIFALGEVATGKGRWNVGQVYVLGKPRPPQLPPAPTCCRELGRCWRSTLAFSCPRPSWETHGRRDDMARSVRKRPQRTLSHLS